MKKLQAFLLLGIISTLLASTGFSDSTPVAAHVLSVKVTGSPGNYRFSVEIQSPDKGCQQYANWWEVISDTGILLYRRILFHSHVQEQPFVRSGGPVAISPTDVVWVRAHMLPTGYGGDVMRGTVQKGFEKTKPIKKLSDSLAQLPPQPDGCAY